MQNMTSFRRYDYYKARHFATLGLLMGLRKVMPSIAATNKTDIKPSLVGTMYRTVQSNMKLIFDNNG